jgi:hypothetical protein
MYPLTSEAKAHSYEALPLERPVHQSSCLWKCDLNLELMLSPLQKSPKYLTKLLGIENNLYFELGCRSNGNMQVKLSFILA